MSKGDFPESLRQAVLAGVMLVGKLGVPGGVPAAAGPELLLEQ